MTTRAYRGVPADTRREQRREALLDAALESMHADGIAGVGVRSVCARARLTPRYFYESFADIDELLLATVDRVSDEVKSASTAALLSAPRGGDAQIRAAIDAGYGVVADDPRKATALLVVAAGHGPLRARRQRFVTDYADTVIASLDVLGSLAPARRRATALFLMGGSADVIEAVLSGRLQMSRGSLVDQLTALWTGALSTPT